MVAVVLPALTGISVIGPVPVADTPVSVPLTDDVHDMVVDPIDDVGRKFNAVPLQTDWTRLGAVFVMTGTGLTVTVMSNGVPVQPFAEGVIL
jgi:hypothetical protein